MKVYADVFARLGHDPTLILGADEYEGAVTLDAKCWREGFQAGHVVAATKLQKSLVRQINL